MSLQFALSVQTSVVWEHEGPQVEFHLRNGWTLAEKSTYHSKIGTMRISVFVRLPVFTEVADAPIFLHLRAIE